MGGARWVQGKKILLPNGIRRNGYEGSLLYTQGGSAKCEDKNIDGVYILTLVSILVDSNTFSAK